MKPRGFGWIELECRPRDWWIGVRWKWGEGHPMPRNRLDVWICLVPCLPLHAVWHFAPRRGA